VVADPRCVHKKPGDPRETKRVADYVVVGNYRLVESIEGMAESSAVQAGSSEARGRSGRRLMIESGAERASAMRCSAINKERPTTDDDDER
jgi:hypothetical protein